ncbi:DeoR family transcriptional regulator, lactose phosphotransferase system repressor [Spiroplasma clarkii]|uniref:hypothetical protein n=1 Tax=Spiroplasma clarkii TaxID=2139 RepID=UPI000B568D38|nr:hypothetical protein [Spiroplasma clarkii]ARU91734.1 DeoR family transcriptional regulator, lactose phosphotransferase system repressor [Spiroplasma clarkii]
MLKITIRRELHKLEAMGYLKLKYGSIDILTYEKYNSDKVYDLFDFDKHYETISSEAIELIDEDDSLFVTSGKTMHYFVKKINKPISLLLTNSVEIAFAAINNGYIKKTIILEGLLIKKSAQPMDPCLKITLMKLM